MKNKHLGQVWTPDWLARHLLTLAGFSGQATLNGPCLETGFGNGAILKLMADRMVAASRRRGDTPEQTATVLSELLHGVEKDSETGDRTVSELVDRLRSSGVPVTSLPNLVTGEQGNFLTFEHSHPFRFIIGNPPYVRVRDMDEQTRQQIADVPGASGTTDLYIAFWLRALDMLSDDGDMAYLTPNGWLRSTSQQGFRKLLDTGKNLRKVTDFGEHQVFDGASTYVTVTYLTKQPAPHPGFIFEKVGKVSETGYEVEEKVVLPYGSGSERVTISPVNAREGTITLGDLPVRFQNGVATLLDKAFLLDNEEAAELMAERGGDGRSLVAPCVKGSTFKGGDEGSGHIILPYLFGSNLEPYPIPSGFWRELYPKTFKHLEGFKDKLLERASDKAARWWEYGRSQALKQTMLPKLVIGPVVGPEGVVEAHAVKAGTVVYSGLFATSADEKGALGPILLADLAELLKTPLFAQWCRAHGKDMRGGYAQFGAPVVKSFPLTDEVLAQISEHSSISKTVAKMMEVRGEGAL